MVLGKILENIAERLELPGSAAAGEVFAGITGGKTVRIENHTGLLEYSDEVIMVSAGKKRVTVFGTELRLEAMNAVSAVISGNIASVSFE